MTEFSIKNHLLYLDGERVNYKLSPNHGKVISPELVVIHYTASDDLASTVKWLCTPQGKKSVSSHLVIARTGQVWQLLPFNLRGFHAGESEYDGRQGVNNFSVGIENMGWGKDWPDVQIEANIGVIKALCAAYDIIDLVGHDEVAIPEGRKVDPGPKYPWKRIGDATGFQWEGI